MTKIKASKTYLPLLLGLEETPIKNYHPLISSKLCKEVALKDWVIDSWIELNGQDDGVTETGDHHDCV